MPSPFAQSRVALHQLAQRLMRHGLILLSMAMMVGNAAAEPSADATEWATAISKHAKDGRVIVFRYVTEFRPSFVKASLPDRVILVWRYETLSGLPVAAEREEMDRMEDMLSPFVEKVGFGMLAMVSTGNGFREWTYYVRSEDEFLKALNVALAGERRFPIEVHTGPDPQWFTYERFRRGIRQ